MAAVMVPTLFTMVGISSVLALSLKARQAAWQWGGASSRLPRTALPFGAGALARERLMDGEAAPTGLAAGVGLRGKSIVAPLFTRTGALSRNGSTLAVALLGLIAAASYVAEGVGAAHWLLPCVGIPVIVGLINLLRSSDH